MRQSIVLIILQLGVLISLQGQSKRMTREQYISRHYQLAIQEMNLFKIPASVILAQGILETESGNSDLARIANNHFGIKCKRTWEGMKYIKDDDTKDECFRAYSTVEESYRDHSIFLQNERYAQLFRLETKDYKSWAYGLKSAGYATNPSYPILLIKHIEEMELYQFDNYGSDSRMPKVTVDSSKQDLEDISSGLIDTNKLKLIARFTSNEKANNLKFVPVDDNFDIISLSQKTASPVSYLFKCNDIEGPIQMYPGQNFFLQLKLKSNPLSIHEAKYGETLYEISQTYGVQLEYLKKYNGIKGWEQPAVGEIVNLNKNRTSPLKTRSLEEVLAEKKQLADEAESKRLQLQGKKELDFYLATATSNTKVPNSDKSILFHQVKAKENIFKIAKLYDVKPNEILEWNQLTLESGISVGQTLKLISSKEPQAHVEPKLKVITEAKEGVGKTGTSNNSLPKNTTKTQPATIVKKEPVQQTKVKKSETTGAKIIPIKDSVVSAPRLLSEANPNSTNINSNIIISKEQSGAKKENSKSASKNVVLNSKKNPQTPSVNNLEGLIEKTKKANPSDTRAETSSKKLIIVD